MVTHDAHIPPLKIATSFHIQHEICSLDGEDWLVDTTSGATGSLTDADGVEEWDGLGLGFRVSGRV